MQWKARCRRDRQTGRSVSFQTNIRQSEHAWSFEAEVGPATGALSRERHFLRTGGETEGDGDVGGMNLGFSRTLGMEDVPRWTADQSLVGDSGERGESSAGSEADLGPALGMTISKRRCHGRTRGVAGVGGNSEGCEENQY
jgi:hypothetical protein